MPLRLLLSRSFHPSCLLSSRNAAPHLLSQTLRRRPFASTSSTLKSSLEDKQRRQEANPAVIDRRERILAEFKHSEEQRGGTVRLGFTILDSTGETTQPHLSYTKAELCSSFGIHPRDVRPIDSNNSVSAGLYGGRKNLVATILPRRSCMIINMLYVRALIRESEIIVFDSAEGPTSGLHKSYENALRKHLSSPDAKEPFSYRALDSLLLSVASTLEAEMTLIRREVRELLQDLEENVSRNALMKLLELTKDLSGLGERVGLVNDAVERCLVDDDIIQAMVLFQNAHTAPDRTAVGGLEDIELMLESFSQRIEEVISEVQTTTANVDSTQEIVELLLSTSRNALLVLDLKLSLLSIGIGFGTLVAGIFGMNLLSGYEEDPRLFYYSSLFILALSTAFVRLGVRKLNHVRRVGLGPLAKGSFKHGSNGQVIGGGWSEERMMRDRETLGVGRWISHRGWPWQKVKENVKGKEVDKGDAL